MTERRNVKEPPDCDIFEDMKRRIRCSYISDLINHKQAILQEFDRMNLKRYPQKQLDDFLQYIFRE